MSRRTRLSGLIAAAMLAAATPVAVAQEGEALDDARAQELYDNGVVLYEEGRYEDAILAWQEAYKLSKRPLLFFNMANAAERLGEYQEAIDHLNHYRAYASAEERESLDRRIKNLERRYDEQRASGALPTADPAAASHGAEPVVPVPATLASSPVPAPAVPAGATLTAVAPAPIGGPPPLHPPTRRGPRAAPLLLYTVGGVGLAAGGTFAGLALSSRSAAGDLCAAAGRQTRCPRAAQPALERDRLYSLLADIGFGVGISGTIGGSVALAVGGRRAADLDEGSGR